MKNFSTIILSFALSAGSFAQLTQSNHAPAAGDTYQMFQCDSTNIQPGPAGAGVTWNFAVTTHSSLLHTYSVSASSSTMFPNATTSLSAPGGNSAFYDSDVTSLRYHGGRLVQSGQLDATMEFTTPATYATYPAVLNTSTTSIFGGMIDLTAPVQTSGTFTGTNKFLADGTGTLILPGNVYNNVMRVVSTQTIESITGLGNGTMYEVRYDYYESGIKPPVFSIVSNTLITPLGSNDQVMVTRLVPNVMVGIKKAVAEETIHLFPNPASDHLTITNPAGKSVEIVLMAADGRVIRRCVSDAGVIQISDLPSGIYFYQLIREGRIVRTGKQVVER